MTGRLGNGPLPGLHLAAAGGEAQKPERNTGLSRMKRIIVDTALRAMLLDLKEPLELYDPSGRLQARLTPYDHPSKSDPETKEAAAQITIDEALKAYFPDLTGPLELCDVYGRLLACVRPHGYTTEEVLAYLEQL
jgi:hypothetical protein